MGIVGAESTIGLQDCDACALAGVDYSLPILIYNAVNHLQRHVGQSQYTCGLFVFDSQMVALS